MQYTKPKLIQLIHIAKNQLAMDEYSYRSLLQRITGKNSCKTMQLAELMQVLHELQQKGFKPRAKNKSPRTQDAKVRHAIVHKIRAQWIEMHKNGMLRDGSEQALNTYACGIVNKIYQKQGRNLRLLNLQSLDYPMGAIVLERMKKWQKRLQLVEK